MIEPRSILEEYCNTVTSPWDNKFVCNIDSEYIIQLIQRLNMVKYCVSRMSRSNSEPNKCIIEVEPVSKELSDNFDDYGDDLYYS